MGIGSLSLGQNRRCVALITGPQVAPRLEKEWNCTPAPPLGPNGLFEGEINVFFFTLFISLVTKLFVPHIQKAGKEM